jgi:preprotein translocase subunit SecE
LGPSLENELESNFWSGSFFSDRFEMKKHTLKKKKRGSRKRAQSDQNLTVVPGSGSDVVKTKEDKKEVTPAPTKIAKKEPEKKKTEKTSIFKFIHIAGQFLRESKIELKKVKWPTRKELLASTAMVIFLVLVVALFLGLIDFGLIKIIKNLLG